MLKVKDWQNHQHYNKRNPPWIKLHRKILNNRAINLLADCYFRILIGLWLLASEDETMEGRLPPIPDIAFRLRRSEHEIHEALQHLGEFIDGYASTALANGYQDACLETETETETDSLPKRYSGNTLSNIRGSDDFSPEERLSLAD